MWRDPVIEAYKPHVDRTLLRENLRLKRAAGRAKDFEAIAKLEVLLEASER